MTPRPRSVRAPHPPRLLLALLLPCQLLVAGAVPAAAEGTVEPARQVALAAVTARLDSLWNARDWSLYRATIDSALPAAAAPGDTAFRLELLIRRGMQQVHFGGGREGEPGLREAVALAEAAEDSARLRAAIRWLSVAVGIQGRGAEARALYERLRELAVAAGDRRHEGWALVGLAWAAVGEGRAREGADLYARAAKLFAAAGDHEGEIWALNGSGFAHSRLQEYDRAIAVYRQVVERARATGFRMAEAQALNNLGHHEYLTGDPGRAVASFDRALRMQLEIGQRREAVIPLVNVALCQARLGRHAEAGDRLGQALEICREDGYRDLTGIVLNELGLLAARRGRHHEAAARFRRALALGDALEREVRARCLVGLSDALAALDSSAAALAVMERGARELADLDLGGYRLEFDTQLGERLLASGQPGPAATHLLAAAGAAVEGGFHGRAVRALDLAARCRLAQGEPGPALDLLERAVAAWEADRGLPADPEWREQRGEAGRSLFTDLAGLLLSPAAGLPAARRAGAAFDQLQAYKARTLRERMSGPGPAGDGAVDEHGGTARLAALQDSVLQEGELLLDAYLGPRTSLLFGISRRECRAVRLPPAGELAGPLHRYHELLSSPEGWRASPAERRALDAAGRDLADLLFGDLRDMLAASERILISPDGALNLLPASALTAAAAAGTPEAAPAGRNWVRVPSASILTRWRRAAAGRDDRTTGSLLAVAGADRDGERALPAAGDEVRTLRRRYRRVTTRLATGGEGVDAAELARHDLLHFATHVRVDDQYPWQSAILPAAEGGDDGLRAAEIAGMELRADLAVLASCASATGRILSGEGVLGLSSAFLSAGVPAVVATLWPVDDAATARLMARFYDGLARGETVAAALAAAQRRVRGRSATSHPFYWAGFVVIGEGSLRVPLARRSPLPRLVVVAGLALLLGGGALLAGRRRRRVR